MESQHPKSHASLVQESELEGAVRSLDDLLAMAQRYRGEGNRRQAEDMYWMLADDHSEAPQGEVARGELRALAHEFDRDGCEHEARAIYERLSPPTRRDATLDP